ncbi:MAG: 3-deoxy-D-manno-octulosonic acid transferase, partial [Spongiibacteraceae bacterium]|nr:3-deoxy-D-manno-octulosonic acid transferase [Spongiibacteraceae bacterium]
TGPSDFNFTALSQKQRAAGAMQIIEGETGLAGQVAALLADAALREQRGRAGLAVIDANRGALARQLALIDQLLAAQVLKSS